MKKAIVREGFDHCNCNVTMALIVAGSPPLPRKPKTLAQTPQLSSWSAQYIVTANTTDISVSTSSDVKCPAAVMAFWGGGERNPNTEVCCYSDSFGD